MALWDTVLAPFGTIVAPRGTQLGTSGSRCRFLSIFGRFWVPPGTLFGAILVTIASFEAAK